MTNTTTAPSAALDFPALDGRPVTEAHAARCASQGHATHLVDGASSGVCPRCGEVSSAPSDATDVSAFDLLVRLVRRGFVPLAQLNPSPVARASARVLYERGLADLQGRNLVPAPGALESLRASQAAAGRFLVELPVIGFQD